MSLVDDPTAPATPERSLLPAAEPSSTTRGWRSLRTWPPSLLLGTVLFVFVVLLLLLTPLIAPYDPAEQDLSQPARPT